MPQKVGSCSCDHCLKPEPVPEQVTTASVRTDPYVLQLEQRLAQLETSAATSQPPQPQQQPDYVVQLQQRLAEFEREKQVRSRKTVFCYRCGQDLHFATDCKNPPNKQLVREKQEARRKQFQEKN